MKIIKFKKTAKDKYKLILEDGKSISLYEDVIINNNLLLSKEIEDSRLNDILKQNNDIHVYSIALNYISIRMRSIKEVKEYLLKKEVSNNLIDITIDKLIKNGYLNDFNFAKAFCNDKVLITNMGPYKIKKELIKYGINNDIIEEVIDEIDNKIIKEKLSNLMEKQVRIKKGSSNNIKIKLLNYFINLGYSKEMILEELSNYDLKSDLSKLKKDYDKFYNKYKNKYDNNNLNFIVTQKLYSKGYTSDDIAKVMKNNN